MKPLVRWWLRLVQGYLPSAYVLAVFLTLAVFLMAVLLAGHTPLQVVGHWGSAYPELFTFGMQMVLVLLTGFIIALAPATQHGLDRLTSLAATPTQAIVITALVSLIACYFNWGLGLVVGAFVARAMGSKVEGLHFPLIIAVAYGAELIRGPSSSIPLVSATEGSFIVRVMGRTVAVADTLYASWNLVVTAGVAVILLASYILLERVVPDAVALHEPPSASAPEAPPSGATFSERLENSYWTNAVFGLFPLLYVVTTVRDEGLQLNLNLVIVIFLTIGIFMHTSPSTYLAAVERAVVSARGIIIQFPIYAGIMGMMRESGLVEIMAGWFVAVSTPQTFPLFTFLSAGLVNVFVPSGGGQWAVQGPVIVRAAMEIGADLPQTIMAFAWGDAWTNQIQPFWALPLLGVAGLSARDIMGYCFLYFLLTGLFISSAFLLLGFL